MAKRALGKTRELQVKLYLAAKGSPQRRFHALYDKIYRKDFLWHGWEQVRANRGGPGVDGVSIDDITTEGVEVLLDTLAEQLRSGTYRPLPVRRVSIPKRDGGERHLGVPAIRDRVVQAAARAVLEPIFEAGFLDCSFGFRPRRSAQQALEAIRVEVERGRVWVVDADIAGFFDAIDRDVLTAALRERVADGKVLKLIGGWLSAGVLAGEQLLHPQTGTPQGGVISPLLANVVLHRLDRVWTEAHWRLGKLVRYADDLVICCPTQERAEAAMAALRAVLAELGLALNQAKTRLVDLREPRTGFDFLGFHHRRVQSRRGRWFCARWPCDRAVRVARDKIRAHTARRWLPLPVEDVLARLNRYLVGWRGYFCWGNSSQVFTDLDRFVTDRVARFISNKHGRRGRNFGLAVLINDPRIRVARLGGTVKGSVIAHAVR